MLTNPRNQAEMGTMNYSDAFGGFLNNCKTRGLSKHTQRAYLCDLLDFENWMLREGITRVDKFIVRQWIADMQKRNLAPASIKRRIACLKATFKWLEEEETLIENPFYNFRAEIRVPRTLPKSLSRSEMKTIFRQSASEAHDSKSISKFTLWLALEILFSTGVRISELCDIRLCDVDSDTGIILIHGKGNRERLVYLVDPNVRTLLERYKKVRLKISTKTENLLITDRCTPANPDFIRRNLHRLTCNANINKRVTPHMIRHSTATHLIESGVDIRFVQKLLGHSSISTTEIYTHVSNASLHASLKKANPRRFINA